MMMLSPQPLWQHSSAWRMMSTLADALERVVHAAIRQVDDGADHVVHLGGIDEVRHAELFGQRLLGRVGVDADDAVRPDDPVCLG